jgi:hypothetical protein
MLKAAGVTGACCAAESLGRALAIEPRLGLHALNHCGAAHTNLALGAAQETVPVGETEADQRRNAELLSGYDYEKYPEAITGYTGQDQQRIAFWRWQHALRTRIGPRGNYKAGLTRLPDGKLVAAVCRDNNNSDPRKRKFTISVYESTNEGTSWREIGKTALYGKEPSLTGLPGGRLVLTAQGGYFGPGAIADQIPVSRSRDGGRTWETEMIPGDDYPRNVIVEPDGSLLMVRALKSDWALKGNGSPNLQLGRSKDAGKRWEFSEGKIDWDYPAFGEVSAIRLRTGTYLATLRRRIPGTSHDWEGYEDTVVTYSKDGGKNWAKPWPMSCTADVQAYLTELHDGRILSTYSNYHLPWGVYAILSKDEGKTWDLERPIQLALSAGIWVGWANTLELPDHTLITSYASTTYYNQLPDRTTCEVVRWRVS